MLSTSIWMKKMLFALNKMKNRKKHHKNCAKHLPSDKFQQFYNSTFFFIVTVLILLFSYIIWWHCAQLIARKRIWKWKLSIECKITCQKDEDIIIVISNQNKKEPLTLLTENSLPQSFLYSDFCLGSAVIAHLLLFSCLWSILNATGAMKQLESSAAIFHHIQFRCCWCSTRQNMLVQWNNTKCVWEVETKWKICKIKTWNKW